MRKSLSILAGVAIWAAPLPVRAAGGLTDAGGADTDAADDAPIVVVATPLGEALPGGTSAQDIEASRATSLAEQLVRTAPGVTVSEVQGNPLQPDISYRGFTASPLLGTPQGLSVYLDGVRLNQPFGEVVSWDLIPQGAIAAMDLVSGAAPQFGRNALGGALVLRSKDGRSDPGLAVQAGGGAFGRITASASAGGHLGGGFDLFATADHFRETGWRAFSPSRATRGFARLGWSGDAVRFDLTALHADTDLNGNGLQEMRLLSADRTSIYTAPDNTRNRATLVAAKAEIQIAPDLTLRGNLFWRGLRTATLNGDANDEALGQSLYQPTAVERAALGAAGYTGFPLAGESQANTAFPQWRCIANVLLNDEPNEKCNGLLNRSRTRQDEIGGGLEAERTAPLGGLPNRLTFGIGLVHSTAHFAQTSQFGYLSADRTVVPVSGPGAFADGTQNSENAFDARVDLRARTTSLGLYLADSVDLAPALRIDVAGRYDRTWLHNRDAITPGGGTGSLDSDPVYGRFNPAAALHWQVRSGLSLSAAWSQASRAPSAVELGCSDPASPCRLPNALAGDPPLRQVIARATELRADLAGRNWSASASLFRTDSGDDILFVTGNTSGYGYFRNFGATRRQGLAIEGQAQLGRIRLQASYTLLDATYRSAERVGGSANSSSDAPAPGFDGAIVIRPGDRLPLVPRHTAKAAARWTAAPWLSFDLDLVAVSGSPARGNENNRHAADGIYFLGPGRSAGYAVANAGIELRLPRPRPKAAAFLIYATIRNLTGSRYASAAQLGATAFDAQGRFVARPFAGPVIAGERPRLSSTFFAPGAPRALEVGARLRW